MDKEFTFWSDEEKKQYQVIIHFGTENLEKCVENVLKDAKARRKLDKSRRDDLK